jgi:HEAT repeat protein
MLLQHRWTSPQYAYGFTKMRRNRLMESFGMIRVRASRYLFVLGVATFIYIMIPSSLLSETSSSSGHILFLARKGQISEAIEAYENTFRLEKQHDFDVLQQLAILILEQGSRSRDPETQLISIFGAGITLHERALPILEEGLASPIGQVQVASLNFLASFQDSYADELINKALKSNFLLTRLEAAHLLAAKKHPKGVHQIESLMYKLDPKLKALFPRLLALHGSSHAMTLLRRLMNDPDLNTRLEAILSSALYHRDDLLPQIRRLSLHIDLTQQEACAVALGVLKDETSVQRLEELTLSPSISVSLAARKSLYQMGRQREKEEIEKIASNGNLFAIALLATIPGSEDTLAPLLSHDNLQISVNAAIALLQRQDPRCLPKLIEVIIKDSRDLALVKVPSPGRGLNFWKIVPSAQENLASIPFALELSTSNREEILAQTFLLPEKYFLALATLIFETKQRALIAPTIHLLEQYHSEATIALLQKYQQQMGAPLIRYYCNLALYRLHEIGPYRENLKKWVSQQQQVELIRFRPYVAWNVRQQEGFFQLTPEDTSHLLIESFQTLAQSQEEDAIEALLTSIKLGHEKNRYALAGLLFRAVL